MNATVVLFSLALLTAACTLNAAPPNPILHHPFLHSATHPIAATEESAATGQTGSQVMTVLPESLVWQEGARAFYSRDVNAISAVAKAGTQEWLATALGVKCVDRVKGEVHHFTRLDGLPGDRILAVAAGSGGIYCISQTTRVGSSPWAICRLDDASERWGVEHELVQPSDAAYQHAFPEDRKEGGFGQAPLPGNACPRLADSVYV